MKLVTTLTFCILALRVQSQSFDSHNQQNNGQNFQYPREQQTAKVSDYDSYLQAISRNPNQNVADQQQYFPTPNDGRIYFEQPSLDLTPPPVDTQSSQNYYSTQEISAPTTIPVLTTRTDRGRTVNKANPRWNNVTLALGNFGLNLIRSAGEFQHGNIIVSPASIATLLALLQQGSTGEAQEQLTNALQITPDVSETAFGPLANTLNKINSRNLLSIANNIVVADAFELNPAFKSVAIRNFGSEVTPINYGRPIEAIQKINAWVASKTNQKILNLLQPGAISQNTQLVLVNAVYFKGIWKTRFKPEVTKLEEFKLENGEKKIVPFMHARHSFQVGIDPNSGALVTILPFEGNQYSLILILPKKTRSIDDELANLSDIQLLRYLNFMKVEIKVEIPRFTIKTDTDLTPVLRNMGIKNIFGSNSELSGIGSYRTYSPQISNAVHSGFLSVDEQGVTAAAATSLAAVALSYDSSSTTFRADRPFIAVLWDSQLSMPLFIAKIRDPS